MLEFANGISNIPDLDNNVIYMFLFCNDRSIQAMLLHNNHNRGVL